jgi:hypothetical protein
MQIMRTRVCKRSLAIWFDVDRRFLLGPCGNAGWKFSIVVVVEGRGEHSGSARSLWLRADAFSRRGGIARFLCCLPSRSRLLVIRVDTLCQDCRRSEDEVFVASPTPRGNRERVLASSLSSEPWISAARLIFGEGFERWLVVRASCC